MKLLVTVEVEVNEDNLDEKLEHHRDNAGTLHRDLAIGAVLMDCAKSRVQFGGMLGTIAQDYEIVGVKVAEK